MRLPSSGVGLLYHQGYFSRRSTATATSTLRTPIRISRTCRSRPSRGDAPKCSCPWTSRRTICSRSGRRKSDTLVLYLLDAASEERAHDRDITHRLYGGGQVIASSRSWCWASAACGPRGAGPEAHRLAHQRRSRRVSRARRALPRTVAQGTRVRPRHWRPYAANTVFTTPPGACGATIIFRRT